MNKTVRFKTTTTTTARTTTTTTTTTKQYILFYKTYFEVYILHCQLYSLKVL